MTDEIMKRIVKTGETGDGMNCQKRKKFRKRCMNVSQ